MNKQCQSEYDEIKLNLIKKSLENNGGDVYVPKERRKGEDKVLKFINFVSFTLWICIVVLVSIFAEVGNRLLHMSEQQLSLVAFEAWFESYVQVVKYLTIFCLVICSFTIILNLTRNKRRTDRIKKSIIIYEIITFIVGVLLIWKF